MCNKLLSTYRSNNVKAKHDEDDIVVFARNECSVRDQNQNAKETVQSEPTPHCIPIDTDSIQVPDLATNVTDVPAHNIATNSIHNTHDSNTSNSNQCHIVVSKSYNNQSLSSTIDTNTTTSSDTPTTETITTNLTNLPTPLQSTSIDGDCALKSRPQQPPCTSTFARCFSNVLNLSLSLSLSLLYHSHILMICFWFVVVGFFCSLISQIAIMPENNKNN